MLIRLLFTNQASLNSLKKFRNISALEKSTTTTSSQIHADAKYSKDRLIRPSGSTVHSTLPIDNQC